MNAMWRWKRLCSHSLWMYAYCASAGLLFVYVAERGRTRVPSLVTWSVSPVAAVKAGDNATVAFKLINSGDEPRTIRSAVTSCGCVKALGLPLTIPARGDALMRVSIKTTGLLDGWTFTVICLSPELSEPLAICKGAICISADASHRHCGDGAACLAARRMSKERRGANVWCENRGRILTPVFVERRS